MGMSFGEVVESKRVIGDGEAAAMDACAVFDLEGGGGEVAFPLGFWAEGDGRAAEHAAGIEDAEAFDAVMGFDKLGHESAFFLDGDLAAGAEFFEGALKSIDVHIADDEGFIAAGAVGGLGHAADFESMPAVVALDGSWACVSHRPRRRSGRGRVVVVLPLGPPACLFFGGFGVLRLWLRCGLRRLGGGGFLGVGSDGALAEERRALGHDHFAGDDIATHDAFGVKFDGVFGVKVAFDGAVDIDAACVDVGLAQGVVADVQFTLAGDFAVELTIDASGAFEGEFAFEVRIVADDRHFGVFRHLYLPAEGFETWRDRPTTGGTLGSSLRRAGRFG